MGIYDRFQATASRLLASKGRASNFLLCSSVRDFVNSDSTTVITTVQVDTVDFDMASGRRYKGGDAGQVLAGDRTVYISGRALSRAPKAGDRVVLGGVTWSVVALVQNIAPAGTAVLYEVQVRR